jgi:hypothetical protein
MKDLAPKIVTEKLSLYIDGMLDDAEMRQVEEYISAHPEAARELTQLRMIQKGLSNAPRAPENSWFWLQLSGTLEERRSRTDVRWKKPWWLSAGVLAAGTAAVLAVVYFKEGDSLKSFVQQKTDEVAQVYSNGLLKGAIMPLLSSIDKEKVLQFALFGNLDLDSTNALQVAKGEGDTYKVELGRCTAKKKITLPQFYAAIGATAEQHEIVDSILNYGKAKIQNAVLVGEQDEIAIHADIAQLNRVMVSTIAASLEPVQRVKFQKMLTDNDAPYLVAKDDAPSAPPEKIFKRIASIPHSNRYVVITEDSVGFAEMPSDVERFMAHAAHVQQLPAPRLRAMGEMMRQFAERRMRIEQKLFSERSPLRVFSNDQVLTIQFDESAGPISESMFGEAVQPRPHAPVRVRGGTQKSLPNDWRTLNRDKQIDLDAVIGAQEERVEEQRQQQKLQQQKLDELKKQQHRKQNIEL